jgi:hypothetical protein
MEIFGYELDIESIELLHTEYDKKNPDGIGEPPSHEGASYNPKTQTLRFTLQFHDNGTPYYYEYVIEKNGDEFDYREIESQREGHEGFEGSLELIDEEDRIILHDEGDETYSYSFCIAKLDG